jgi:hypothetical protein
MSVPERLVDQSSITVRQLEVLASHLRVASGEIKLSAAASMVSQGKQKSREKPTLTIGSYSRTVSQARANIRESLVTVVIALWLGVIRAEDTRRLFDLVGGGARELSEEESERFLQLLDALLRRIIV